MRIEEYDDGYTRESFERADEDTPETVDPTPPKPRDTHKDAHPDDIGHGGMFPYPDNL